MGTPRIVCCTGAGLTSTTTTAFVGTFRRTLDSATPIVTVSRTRPIAPRRLTGSVVAWVSWLMTLSGPTTSTDAGEAVTRPRTYPSAGSPSMAGTTGTVFVADASNMSGTVGGTTPRGARQPGWSRCREGGGTFVGPA